jgi:hypothetical protein
VNIGGIRAAHKFPRWQRGQMLHTLEGFSSPYAAVCKVTRSMATEKALPGLPG